MSIQVCYFKHNISITEIIDALSKIYNKDIDEIGLFDYENKNNFLIRFQITNYVSNADFNYQLEIYISDEDIIQSKIFNNLILSLKINQILYVDLLIHDESDNPFQWILISGNEAFLVEEMIENTGGFGINIDFKNRQKLNKAKAIEIMPNENDIILKYYDKGYFVKNSNKWLEILE